MPAHWSHLLASPCLSIFSSIAGSRKPPHWKSFKWGNLEFPNPLAPAGGVDKSGRQIKAWWALGAGFIEVGTITPLPQKANKGVILKRNIRNQALWNYMGFPGDGVQAVCNRLKALGTQRSTPIFANIGKNRDTVLEESYKDYIQCISVLNPYVDAFVINISSPNTKGLRNLSTPTYLKTLLDQINCHFSSMKDKKPVFIKWSPDMDERDFLNALDQAGAYGVEGHIICNSSQILGRNLQQCVFSKHGGVSGSPLIDIARQRLMLAHKHLAYDRKKYLLISSGGVLKPEDVFERLDIGANLVQVYSALIFDGPHFFLKTKSVFEKL